MDKHCANYSTTFPAPQKSRLNHSKYTHHFFTVYKTSQENRHIYIKTSLKAYTQSGMSEHPETDARSDYTSFSVILSGFFCCLNIHYMIIFGLLLNLFFKQNTFDIFKMELFLNNPTACTKCM